MSYLAHIPKRMAMGPKIMPKNFRKQIPTIPHTTDAMALAAMPTGAVLMGSVSSGTSVVVMGGAAVGIVAGMVP